jgi:hypothetical protein
MGCDIHCYVEYRERDDDQWRGWPRINPGRNYELFSWLKGVRNYENVNPIVPRDRTIPLDLGWYAASDFWIPVSDEQKYENQVTSEQAALYRDKYGALVKLNDAGGAQYVQSPDWHTAGWCCWEELREVIKSTKQPKLHVLEYEAVQAAMQALTTSTTVSRLVFWFDN